MTLKDFLSVLIDHPQSALQIQLPDGTFVPAHFHVTEVGRVQKDFIDCGGTVRRTETSVLQVWVANDFDHRLETAKLVGIIQKGASLFETTDIPLEIEYDTGVISQYPVRRVENTPAGILIQLESKHTACLAPELCKVDLLQLQTPSATACCGPGCC